MILPTALTNDQSAEKARRESDKRIKGKEEELKTSEKHRRSTTDMLKAYQTEHCQFVIDGCYRHK